MEKQYLMMRFTSYIPTPGLIHSFSTRIYFWCTEVSYNTFNRQYMLEHFLVANIEIGKIDKRGGRVLIRSWGDLDRFSKIDKGPLKKYVTGLGGGVKAKQRKRLTRGEGVKPKSDVTTSKKCCFNNRIRMTLKVVVTPLYLLFNVAFRADNKA